MSEQTPSAEAPYYPFDEIPINDPIVGYEVAADMFDNLYNDATDRLIEARNAGDITAVETYAKEQERYRLYPRLLSFENLSEIEAALREFAPLSREATKRLIARGIAERNSLGDDR